jgi:hypothetical protein
MKQRLQKTDQNASRGEKTQYERHGPGRSLPAWVAALVLSLAIGIVYGRALDSPFIFDDRAAIIHNASITALWPLIGTSGHHGPLNPMNGVPTRGRPLVNLSFAINYYLGGYSTTGYHAFNVIVHFGSAMLLWAITRRTLLLPYFRGRFDMSADWLALAVAVVWALHPCVRS